ncbi:putative glycosyltranferase [Pseudomonas sp. IT-347P]|uniref:glycosyltransferase n=1 Tax=Pseudomonas sp. IT-347P TaxID=3026458 RepID=UPI0039E10AA5
MHILFILKDFKAGGGVERVQQRLSEQFLRDGRRVSFFVINADMPDTPGVQCFNGGGRGFAGMLKSVVMLRRLVHREGVTHLISAKEQANLCTWFATLGSACNVIYSRHATLDCSEQKTGPSSLRLLYSLYLCGSGKVVTVSTALRQTLVDLLPWGRQRIRYCPNAVVTEQLFHASRAPRPQGLPDHYWLSVGRLVEPKGFHLLLDAYATALRSAVLPDLVIVGDGPLLDTLTTQAERLGIARRVHFTGFLGNPYPLLRQARLFILSSLQEGMPTVLIEALALGTPVLACDCETGPRELLDNGRLGQLVKANDVPALADGMLRSLTAHPAPAPSEKRLTDTLRPYTSQYAAQAYYQVWNQ